MIMWGNIFKLVLILGIPFSLLLGLYLYNLKLTCDGWKAFATKAGLTYMKKKNIVAGSYMGHGVDLSIYYPSRSNFTNDPLYTPHGRSHYQTCTKLSVHFNIPYAGTIKLRTRRNILLQASRLIQPEIRLGDPAFDQNFYLTSNDPNLPHYAFPPTARPRFQRLKYWEFTWTLGKGNAVLMGRIKDPVVLMEALWALHEVTMAIEGAMMQTQQQMVQTQMAQQQFQKYPVPNQPIANDPSL
jgi:hypothetical protein